MIFTDFNFLICDSSSSPKLAECLHKKKETIEQMEVKLDTGIDRSVCETTLMWDLFCPFDNVLTKQHIRSIVHDEP